MKGTASLVRWQGRAPREYSSGPSRTRASGHRASGSGRSHRATGASVRSGREDLGQGRLRGARHVRAGGARRGDAAQGRDDRRGAGDLAVVPREHPGRPQARRPRAGVTRARRRLQHDAGPPRRSRSPTSSAPSKARSPTSAASAGGARVHGPAAALREVWLANRVSVRHVLERVTIADVVASTLPPDVLALLDDPDALVSH